MVSQVSPDGNGWADRIGPYLSVLTRSHCVWSPQSPDGSWLIFHRLMVTLGGFQTNSSDLTQSTY